MGEARRYKGDDYYEALREKYALERDRRIRSDGQDQYVELKGEYSERYYAVDPNAPGVMPREAVCEEIDVLVVGAGWTGIMTAGRLKQEGVTSIRVIDEAWDFGGTWYWNRYPGAQCDVESYCYLPLLEETGYMPKEKYAFGQEIFDYALMLADHFELREHALFGTRILEMRWNEEAGRWVIVTDSGDEIHARFVTYGVGPASRAKLPRIPGLDEFEGHTFHTSRWDFDYTGGNNFGGLDKLANKRVAIIGTGCTAVQCIPHLAEGAQHLFVFQRTPAAVDERRNRPTDLEWFRSQEPGWQFLRRKNFDDVMNMRPFDEDMVADGWLDMARWIALDEDPMAGMGLDDTPEAMALREEIADLEKMDEIRARIDETVQDEATAELLKPWYRRMCKRPVFHDDYLPAFNRDNVTLVDTSPSHGVERLTRKGVVANGVEYEVDCIIFSTGFEQASGYEKRFSVEIYGREGISLYDHWAEGMRTLHGHSVHGFPNWFFLGQGQIGLTFNFCAVIEPVVNQVSYIIGEALRRGLNVVEATAEGEQAWVDEVHASAPGNEDFLEACTPGYYNSEGKIRDSKVSFWSDFYWGGIFIFLDKLARWREDGSMPGMVTRGPD